MMQSENPDMSGDGNPPSLATEAVLVKSDSLPKDTPTVKGYDFNDGVNYHKLLQSYTRSGIQAQNFGKAAEEINRMIDCKLTLVAKENMNELNMHPTARQQTNCSIFLSYTSWCEGGPEIPGTT